MGFLKGHNKDSTSSASISASASISPSPAASQLLLTKHPNTSTSNLSTTTTLLDAPYIQTQSRFRGSETEARSQAWPHDPWRGGFGPGTRYGVMVGDRWLTGKEEGREARREIGEWLKKNGLRKRRK